MTVPPGRDDNMDPPAPGSWFDSDPPRTTYYTPEASNSHSHRSSYPSRGGSGARSRPRTQSGRLSRDELRDFAELTLLTIEEGEYTPPGSRTSYDLETRVNYTNENTSYYSPDDAAISGWTSAPLQRLPAGRRTQITIKQYSTLVGARVLHGRLEYHHEGHKKIGVLNFASAKKPGGGFLNGSQAQEESIARSSTLYPSLVTPVATQFYAHYADDPDNPYYTHAMVYSPDVVLIRNDKGEWKYPIRVDVLTSAAVNAGEIRKKLNWEEDMRLLRARVRAAEAARAREAERRRQAAEAGKARDAERRQQREEQRRRMMAEERAKAADARRKRDEEMKKAEQDTGNDDEGTSGQMDGMDVDQPSLKEPGDAEMAEVPTEAEAKDNKSELTAVEAIKPSQRDVIAPLTEPASSSTPQIDRVPTNSDAEVQLNEQISEAPLGKPAMVAPPNTIDSSHETRPEDIPSAATPPPEGPSLATLLEMAETDINKEMHERIGRLLYLFHARGAQHLVLGSFGTGVFQNDVETVAGIFSDLLANPNGRFYNIFESVVFAILDAPTVRGFTKVFKSAALDDAEDAQYVSSAEETQDGKGEEVPARKGTPTTEGAGERHSDETSTRTIAAPDTEASVIPNDESQQATQSEDADRDHTTGSQTVDSTVDQVKGLDKEWPAMPTLAPL